MHPVDAQAYKCASFQEEAYVLYCMAVTPAGNLVMMCYPLSPITIQYLSAHEDGPVHCVMPLSAIF